MTRSTESSPRHESARDRVLAQFRDPEHRTIQAGENPRAKWTDARSIREEFGVPPYDPEAWDYRNVLPNVIEHTWSASPDQTAGGTDILGSGKPGSGKSTFCCHLALRQIEVNDEKVVWRGSGSRSEWLPMAPWTRLCLPANRSVTARLVPRDPTAEVVDLSLDELEEHIVREIVRYEDPVDLNQEVLAPGQIHVVYPDPQLRGCQWLYEESEKTIQPPTGRDELFAAEDPVEHWWFAWFLARVDQGPYDWTTVILDEIGDIAPEAARSDDFGTYQKIELLRDCWVDARKTGLTPFAFGHSERDIHNLIRHKIRWRITMNGAANPTSKSDIVGFDSMPMNTDMTSRMDLGEGLIFTEQNFEKIKWPDYPAPVDHKLQIKVGGA